MLEVETTCMGNMSASVKDDESQDEMETLRLEETDIKDSILMDKLEVTATNDVDITLNSDFPAKLESNKSDTDLDTKTLLQQLEEAINHDDPTDIEVDSPTSSDIALEEAKLTIEAIRAIDGPIKEETTESKKDLELESESMLNLEKELLGDITTSEDNKKNNEEKNDTALEKLLEETISESVESKNEQNEVTIEEADTTDVDEVLEQKTPDSTETSEKEGVSDIADVALENSDSDTIASVSNDKEMDCEPVSIAESEVTLKRPNEDDSEVVEEPPLKRARSQDLEGSNINPEPEAADDITNVPESSKSDKNLEVEKEQIEKPVSTENDESNDKESKVDQEKIDTLLSIDEQSSSDIQEPKESKVQPKDIDKSSTALIFDQSSSESLLVMSGNRRRSDADNQDEPDSTDQNSTTKRRPASPVQDEETCDSFNKKARLESVDSTEGHETKESEIVLETPQLSTGEVKKEEDSNEAKSKPLPEQMPIVEEKPCTTPLKVDDIPIKPTPNAVPEKKESLSMDFMKKFKKSFQLMGRRDLEEFVLQKIIETIVHKSEIAELRQKTEAQETALSAQRQRVNDITKQFRDLEMVHSRVVKDLETKAQGIVTPVKITRAVGLQVSQPRVAQEKKTNPIYPQQYPQNQRAAPFPSRSPQRMGQGLNIQAANQQRIQGMPQRQAMQNSAALAAQQQFTKKVNVKITPMRPPMPNSQKIQFEQQQKAQNEQLLLLQKQKAMQRQQQLQEQRRLQQIQAQRQSAAPNISPGNKVTTMVMNAQGVQRSIAIATQQQLRNIAGQGTTIIRKVPQQSARPGGQQNSLIDLTDEDEQPLRQVQNVNGSTNQISMTKIQVKSPHVLNASIGGSPGPASMTNRIVQQGGIPGKAQAPRMAVGQFVQIPSQSAGGVAQMQVIRRPSNISTTLQKRPVHPAPLPITTNKVNNPAWKKAPPRPQIRINNIDTGIVISWTMNDPKLTDDFSDILSYQIYAYQETNQAPATEMWRHVGDVKAMALPMAVTLTQFQEGQRYHFAVRALDEHGRCGLFSVPRTWDEPK